MEKVILVDNNGLEINTFRIIDLEKVDYDKSDKNILVITYKNHAEQRYPANMVKVVLR